MPRRMGGIGCLTALFDEKGRERTDGTARGHRWDMAAGSPCTRALPPRDLDAARDPVPRRLRLGHEDRLDHRRTGVRTRGGADLVPVGSAQGLLGLRRATIVMAGPPSTQSRPEHCG